jgi:hypothetical protein
MLALLFTDNPISNFSLDQNAANTSPHLLSLSKPLLTIPRAVDCFNYYSNPQIMIHTMLLQTRSFYGA